MWDEITYPFPNFNGGTVGVWGMDTWFHRTLNGPCDYLFMLEFKLNHVSKRGLLWLWGTVQCQPAWCGHCHYSDATWTPWRLDCLLNSLFRLATGEHQSTSLLAFCQGRPLVTAEFPSKRVSTLAAADSRWETENQSREHNFLPLSGVNPCGHLSTCLVRARFYRRWRDVRTMRISNHEFNVVTNEAGGHIQFCVRMYNVYCRL